MANHTPGPWEVKKSLSKLAFNVIARTIGCKYKIARCPYAVPTEEEKSEALANAKLISAAPDLLAALKIVDAHIAGEYDDPVWTPAQIFIIKEAIKKATKK